MPRAQQNLLKLIPFLILFIGICTFKIYYADLMIAIKGWSLSGVLWPKLHPHDFANNFPNGAENLVISFYTSILMFFSNAFQINPIFLSKIQISLDIIFLMLAGALSVRFLRPKSSYFVYLLVIASLVVGYHRKCNLASFGVPFFGYEPYCIAESFAAIGCIAVLYQRYLLSAFLLAVSVISHPVIGMYGCIFAVASTIPVWRQLLNIKAIIGLIIFLVIVLSWFINKIPGTAMGSSRIPNGNWIELIQMMNYHLFPILRGVISFNSYKSFFPFVASTILLLYYLTNESIKDELTIRVLNGSIVLLILSILGVFLPLLNNPFLIKIALSRASVFLLFFSIIYTSYGLYKDSFSENRIFSFISSVLIIFPFISIDGFSIYWVIAFCLFSGRFSNLSKRSTLLVMTFLGILVIVTLIYNYLGYAGPSKFGLNIFLVKIN